MTKTRRSISRAGRKPGASILALAAVSLLLSLAWTSPLGATQRMVLTEEYTNSG